MNKSIFSNENLADTRIVSIDNITSINIKTSACDIDVESYEQSELKAELYFKDKSYSNYFLFTVENVGNAIDISLKKNNFFSIIFSKIYIKIYMPINYSNNININVTSGNISLNSLVTNTLDSSVISGRSILNNITCKNLNTTSMSGNIELTNITSPIVNINSISGSIDCTLNNNETFSYDISRLYISNTSGKILTKIDGFYRETSISNISGGIDVIMNEKANYTCTTKNISGKIQIEEAINKDITYKSNINIRNSSGHILLRNH